MKTIVIIFVIFLNYFNVMSQPINLMQENNQSSKIEFIENRGQFVDFDGNLIPDIKYTASIEGQQLYVRDNGISFLFSQFEEDTTAVIDSNMLMMGIEPMAGTMTYHRMDMNLVGANFNATVRGLEKQPQYNNYYYTHCPDGITHVPVYAKVQYEEIYPDIDFVLYTKENVGLEYDFVVKPGGDPSQIKLKFDEADNASISQEGNLIAENILGKIEQLKPYSYQNINGGRKEVKSSFKLNSNGEISFELDEYDKSKELVIDPITRVFGTYYGGEDYEISNGINTDYENNILVCGFTRSSNNGQMLATNGALKIELKGGDAGDGFICKIGPSGDRLWSTYYGGDNKESVYGITTDINMNIYCVGASNSDNLSTTGIHQEEHKGKDDAYILKLTDEGIKIWCSYYGGESYEIGNAIKLDNNENIIVTGHTMSHNNISTNGSTLQDEILFDAFLAKFSINGELLWGTYYGGKEIDEGIDLAIDANNNIYLLGHTCSKQGIATKDAFQKAYSDWGDAFIAKFDSNGVVVWGTYYGNKYFEMASSSNTGYYGGIGLDSEENIIITGYAMSQENHHTDNANYYNNPNNWDCIFTAKFNNDGQRLWGRIFSGQAHDQAMDLAIDRNSNIYVIGTTLNNNYSGEYDYISTDDAYQRERSGYTDGCIIKLSPDGDRIWGTYFGGPEGDYIYSIAIDKLDNFYITGRTKSKKNISNNGFQASFNGDWDAFIVKFNDPTINIMELSGPFLTNEEYNVKFESYCNLTSANRYTVELSDSSGNFSNPTIIVEKGGVGSGKIKVIIPDTIPFGTGYKFRMVASDPKTIGLETEEEYTIYPNPDMNIIGKNAVIISETIEYSVIDTKGIENYWSVKGGEIIGNSDEHMLSVKWTDSGNGKIKLVRRITDIDYADSTEKEITIHVKPSMDIDFEESVCQGDTIKYSIEENDAVKNNWFVIGGEVVGNSNEANLLVNWTEEGKGIIKLIRQIDEAEYRDSAEFSIKINTRPDKSEISRDGNKLVSSSETGNQWYLNDNMIDGAINRFYIPEKDGNYSVQIVNQYKCSSEFSERYQYQKNSTKDKEERPIIYIYPNPAIANIANIRIKNSFSDEASIIVYNLFGHTVFDEKFHFPNKQDIKLDFSNQPNGIYFIKMWINNQVYNFKIIKN